MNELASTICTLLLVAPLGAQVLTVGPPGTGADFTDIQPAIDAAPGGATLILLPGSYAHFVLDKAVDVLGPGPELATVAATAADTSAVSVRDLAAGATVVVAGFTAVGGASTCEASFFTTGMCVPFIEVDGCLGRVILQELVAESTQTPGPSGPPMRVTDSQDVHVYACQLEGEGHSGSTYPTVGLEVESSGLRLVDSSVRGGSGIHDAAPNTGDVGLLLSASSLELVRSSVLGGDGGSSSALGGFSGSAAPGLAAIFAEASTLRLLGGPGSLIQAGANACWSTGHCWDGSPALMLVAGSHATWTSAQALQGGEPSCSSSFGCPGFLAGPPFASDARSLVVENATSYPSLGSQAAGVAPGDPIQIDIDGEPGALVTLYWSPQLGPSLSLPGIDGEVVLDLGSVSQLGSHVLDPAGAAVQQVSTPPIPALVGLTAHLQGLQLGSHVGVSTPWLVFLR